MDPIVSALLQYGPAGLAVAALLTGLVVPKYVADEYRKRIIAQDDRIGELAGALQRLGDIAEAKVR